MIGRSVVAAMARDMELHMEGRIPEAGGGSTLKFALQPPSLVLSQLMWSKSHSEER